MDLRAIRDLRKYLRAIEQEVEFQLKNQTRCCGVTSAQCQALVELAEVGQVSLVELSERLMLDTSTLSRTIEGLVRAGYVTRTINPGNRRYVQLALTENGRQKTDFINHSSDQFYMGLLSHLPGKRLGSLIDAVKLLSEILAEKRKMELCPVIALSNERSTRNERSN